MSFKRIILAGLAVDAISFLIFPLFFSNALFGWVFRLEPTNIWKWTPEIPFTAMPVGYLVFFVLANTVLAVFIAFLYALLHKTIPGTGVKKGLMFGLLLSPIGVFIPMFSIWAMFRVAGVTVLLFTAEQFIEILVYGAVVAAIYGEYHQCPVCGFRYREKEWADKCEAWCKAHQSCNLEIIAHGIPPKTNAGNKLVV